MNLSALKKVGTVLKIAGVVAQIEQLNKKGETNVMKFIPLIITLVTTLASAVAAPDFVSHHLTLYAILNAASQALHSVLPSTAKQ